MKKTILIITAALISFSTFCQLPDKSLGSENLKGKVKEVNTNIYYYRTTQKSYVLSSSDKMKYNDGNLIYHYSEFGSLLSNYEYEYTYEDGNLVKLTSRNISKKTSQVELENYTNYLYSSGNLTEINLTGTDPTTISFEYNNKNQVIKEAKVGIGAIKKYEKIYAYQSNSAYSITSYFYSKGEKAEKPNVFNYEKGNLVSSEMNGYGSPSKGAYSFNDNGDKISYYYNGKLSSEYFYEYDNQNNWITRVEKRFNTFSESISYTYSFRQLTYKKGITGGTEVNSNLLKKYETRDSYEVKPYEVTDYNKILLNPTEVKELFVLKTEGSQFKVKTDAGNYLTNKVNAVKHTNGLDMILYHPNSNTTALVKDFNEELFKQDFWHKAEILSSTDSMFWTVNEKGSWYITEKGKPYSGYEATSLKYSTENPDDVIVYINEVATYMMKNYRNATPHKLYVLRKI